MGQNYNLKITNKVFGSVENLRYLKKTLTNQNYMNVKSKRRLNSGNTCCHFAQNVLSFQLLLQKLNTEMYCVLFSMGAELGLSF